MEKHERSKKQPTCEKSSEISEASWDACVSYLKIIFGYSSKLGSKFLDPKKTKGKYASTHLKVHKQSTSQIKGEERRTKCEASLEFEKDHPETSTNGFPSLYIGDIDISIEEVFASPNPIDH